MGKARTEGRKKVAKKKAAPRDRAAGASEALLSTKQKQSLLRPGADLDEMTHAFLAGWEQARRKVRVPDVSPAKLRSAVRRAEALQARLDRELAKSEARLAPLRDAVLEARHAAFDMVLAGNKMVGALSDRHPDVANAFRPFTAMWTRRYAKRRARGG